MSDISGYDAWKLAAPPEHDCPGDRPCVECGTRMCRDCVTTRCEGCNGALCDPQANECAKKFDGCWWCSECLPAHRAAVEADEAEDSDGDYQNWLFAEDEREKRHHETD